MTFPRQSDPLTVQSAPREIIVSPEAASDVTAMSLINVFLRYRVLIVLMTLGFGFYAGYNSITSSKRYTTYASFMPKGARGGGQLGGIAAQFGISLAGGDAMNAPQLYTDLIETRTILWPVAQKTYRVNHPERGVIEGDIITIFNIKGRPNVREVRAVNSLRGAVKGTVVAKTGVIEMTVSTGYPELSLAVANNVLAQLNEYNLQVRQATAAAEREFVERQVEEKRAELRAAEAQLENFLDTNRQWRSSAQLTLEYGRLQRLVDLRQGLYSRMLEAYENARIEEVRNLPVINVIETPQLPIGPDARGGVRKTAVGMIVGFTLAVILAFILNLFAKTRASNSDEVLEFAALKREALGDLTHPWRPITRVISSRQRK
jgi:uncharacterized protein involved in exopolysaccharide biosynthesis